MPDVLQFVDQIGDVAAAIDAFGRTVSSGWGAADSGQTWSTSGGSPSDYSVSAGQGRHSMSSLNVSRWTTLPFSVRDVTVTASAATDVLATGGSHFLHTAARWIDPSNCYLARLEFTTTQQVILTLRARVSAVDTVLGTFTTSITHAANTMIVCKLNVSGSTVRAKAWQGSEPAGWQVEATDTSLTGPGAVGVRSLLSAANTNTLPVTASWDDVTVAGPATLRLDLNDDVTWNLQYEGTDFSPPELRQAWTSTLLADGATLTAAAYANRTVRLRLDLLTGSLDAAWTQMQALHRELNRERNFLRWWPQGSANPVWFRTIRSMANRVTEYPGPGLLRTVEVAIEAEPFAIGPKETLTVAAVTNDPAAGSNGQFFDVTGVRGDVETPLYVLIPKTLALVQGGELTGKKKTLVAVRRRGTPSAAPYALQAESMTANPIIGVTDTSTVAVGTASGGSARRTTFASSTSFVARLRMDPFPAAASVDAAGTYRVFGRVAAGDGSSTFTLGLRWGSADFVVSNPTTTVSRTSTSWFYVDFGIVQMPPGLQAGSDQSGVAEQVRGIRVDLVASRTVGAGSLDWDFLVFTPADDRLLLAEWPHGQNVDAAVSDFVLDPVREAGYARDSAGARFAVEPIGIEGGFPMVSPGVTNRVTLIRDVNGWASGTDDTITSNPQPGAWYYPRYLYARPATT